MGRDSNKDPEMVAARERTLGLLSELADVVEVALDDFLRDPRWCGLPGKDVGKIHPPSYPTFRRLDRWLNDSIKARVQRNNYWTDLATPTNAEEGAEYHGFHIRALASMFRDGMPSFKHDWNKPKGEWAVEKESPARFLDRIRGEMRYAHRLDDESMMTVCFALLECKKVGKPRADTEQVDRGYASEMHPDGGRQWLGYEHRPLGTFSQKYEYRPIKSALASTMTSVLDVQRGIRGVYDHVGVALLPRNPSKADLMFIEWIHGRGGKARSMEVRKWLTSAGLADGGDDPAFPYFKKWCDKTGTARSQAPWELRPEALTLIQGKKP